MSIKRDLYVGRASIYYEYKSQIRLTAVKVAQIFNRKLVFIPLII